MTLHLVGISHHSAPVELRERVAVGLETASSVARSLADGCETVVLSTCNRTELYLAATGVERLAERADEALLSLAGAARDELEPLLYRLTDESAALHLFRVTAGLDSLTPGEEQIVGQVRDAFRAGTTGPLLDRVFRMALQAGRRARLETMTGESAVSVPAAAAALAEQVLEGLSERRVLLVGAGRTSDLTARNLHARGAHVLAIANGTSTTGIGPVARFGARAIGLHELPSAVAEADVVVSSTSTPDLVLRAADLAEALRARDGRPLLLVDLAVPRDVDPEISAFDGCFVYDIDDLEATVAASLAGRREEAVHAERIVDDEVGRFREWQASLTVVSAITSLRARAEEIRSAELARLERRLERLPEGERRLVETLTAQIVNTLLHAPTVRMEAAAVSADGLVYADVVRHLFALEEDGEPSS